ncbi:MAG: hypothetical protein KGY76_00285 [Candidatus Thermoplasmatota archaeon]|nr:hypothetical protein [Candidatus Thermoplasmatota archaeon]
MTDIDELKERFLDRYEEDKSKEELQNDIKDEFLKDEMVDLVESAGIEVKSGWTKDDLSEKMASGDFRENISAKKKGTGGAEEKSSIKDMLSPSKLLMTFATGDSKDMENFWEELQKEVMKGFEDFEITPQRYWKDVEKEWKERSRKLQKKIEELAGEEIPEEDVDELMNLWKGFVKEMNLQLGEIPIELKLRKDNILNTIKKHTNKSKKMIANPEEDASELYTLWFDMLEEIREELEEARNFMEDREESIYELWEEFRKDFTEKLKDISTEYGGEEIENLEKFWDVLSEDFEAQLSEGFEEHDHLYEAFWKKMGKEKPKMLKKIEEFREETLEDYSGIVEKALDSFKETYEEMVVPSRKKKEEEIKELKDRIDELEQKLEEQESS